MSILNNTNRHVKMIWPLLGQFWKKIGQLFIPSSGHTGYNLAFSGCLLIKPFFSNSFLLGAWTNSSLAIWRFYMSRRFFWALRNAFVNADRFGHS